VQSFLGPFFSVMIEMNWQRLIFGFGESRNREESDYE
jgi:hypothetical protein